MSFFERLERIEKQIEACHKAACDQSLSKQEQAGALLGWMDWQTARTGKSIRDGYLRNTREINRLLIGGQK